MSRKLIKSGLVVSVMTLLSRILGLARDVVVARLMGDGAAADVFSSPIKFPISYVVFFRRGVCASLYSGINRSSPTR